MGIATDELCCTKKQVLYACQQNIRYLSSLDEHKRNDSFRILEQVMQTLENPEERAVYDRETGIRRPVGRN